MRFRLFIEFAALATVGGRGWRRSRSPGEAAGDAGQCSAAKSASAGVTADSHPSSGVITIVAKKFKVHAAGASLRSSPGHPTIIIAAAICLVLLITRTSAAEDDNKSDGAAAASSYRIGGHGDCVACYAHPSNTPAYGGYYVGGGAAFHGDERFADEGTWGWDYFGRHLNRRIDLGWWHGAHYQGGIGAYKTDGPKLHH